MSGGVERGYCEMIGGDEDAFKRLEPIFAALAPGMGDVGRTPGRPENKGTAEKGYLYCGASGAGHFVKMVHNGIEYGVMQAYAEGFDIMRGASNEHLKAGLSYELDLPEIAEVWRRGSVISSWLLDLSAQALVASPQLQEYTGLSRIPAKVAGPSRPRLKKECRRMCSLPHFSRASGPGTNTRSRRRCYPRCARALGATLNARKKTR